MTIETGVDRQEKYSKSHGNVFLVLLLVSFIKMLLADDITVLFKYTQPQRSAVTLACLKVDARTRLTACELLCFIMGRLRSPVVCLGLYSVFYIQNSNIYQHLKLKSGST